jgi:hypothetical protein
MFYNMVAELNAWRRGPLNQILKNRFAAKQGKSPQIPSIQVKKVKEIVNEMILLAPSSMA